MPFEKIIFGEKLFHDFFFFASIFWLGRFFFFFLLHLLGWCCVVMWAIILSQFLICCLQLWVNLLKLCIFLCFHQFVPVWWLRILIFVVVAALLLIMRIYFVKNFCMLLNCDLVPYSSFELILIRQYVWIVYTLHGGSFWVILGKHWVVLRWLVHFVAFSKRLKVPCLSCVWCRELSSFQLFVHPFLHYRQIYLLNTGTCHVYDLS